MDIIVIPINALGQFVAVMDKNPWIIIHHR